MSYSYKPAYYPSESQDRVHKTMREIHEESVGNNNWRRESGAYEDETQRYRIETEVFEMRRYDQNPRGSRPNGAAPRGHAPSPGFDDDEYTNETQFFERGRIYQLQKEREMIQCKTFTKWCNSFLNRARLEIEDLFSDLADGVLLMRLLEIISGEKLGKPNRGRMRVQKIENLNKVLDFLKKKRIQLENIGAEDILDGNERLILGLIWTIILRFQIDTIVIDDEDETGARKHAKDALLLWCQRKTAGYPNVKVDNFTTSWRSGLAFNALIHAHRPDLINYDALNPSDHIGNLNNAFDVAEKHLEITRLLDAEDIDVSRPDEKSIITYVSLYYHHFAKQKTEMTGARRVANIVGKLMDSESMEDDYEHISSELLKWIKETIAMLDSRRFPNHLDGMKEEHQRFTFFRTQEKPPKYKEKGELEALFFTIQTKRKAMGRKAYAPPQGQLLHDIESAWERLDKAENDRQLAIIKELQRQERLEQLAQRFHKKAKMREHWLANVHAILEEMEHGRTAGEVEKAVKKQQAIATDILAREDRFKMLTIMATDLTNERYHDADRIRATERTIIDRWNQLLTLLEQRRRVLTSLNDLMTLLRDMDTLTSELQQMEGGLRSRDVGKHLMGVEELLERHELIEAQMNAHGQWLRNVTKQANDYIRNKGEQYDTLQRKLDDVTAQYENLASLCRNRRLNLERAKELFQFIQDHEEEMAWLAEKETIARTALASGDIAAVPQTTKLFKSIENEMTAHWAKSKKIIGLGEKLIGLGQNKEDIQRRLATMQQAWDNLRAVVSALGKWLAEAHEAQQYFQDANEAESWIREKMPLVKSDDLGRDEMAAESLLQRHGRLEEEIHAYKSDIQRLEKIAAKLADSSFHENSSSAETEDIQVPQLEMLYKYEGNGMKVAKGEIIALLEKSTAEWWRVLKQDGHEGYVPANYCKLVPNQFITVTQSVSPLKAKERKETGGGKQAVLERQKAISNGYKELNYLADVRRRLLADNIKLMRFYRECNEFETWAVGTKQALADEPTVEHVKEYRKKFDRLESEMKASGATQLKRINDMAGELIAEGHSQQRNIEQRQKMMNAIWDDLERLRRQRAEKLAALERVDDFNNSCNDVKSWLDSKRDQLNRNPNDMKNLTNLEKDLKPLQDKIKELEALANKIRKDHPEEAAAIDRRVAELKAMYDDLLRQANEKMREAEQSQGKEIFDIALRDLLNWIDRTKKTLNEDVHAVNVPEAEELLKKHYDLGEQIKDKKYEQEYCEELGKRLLQKNPRMKEVKDDLNYLNEQMADLKELYRHRDSLLRQQLDLQLFNREAERIDAATKGHETFLDYADLGDSVESVDNLLRRHKDFEAKLDAQEARLEAFSASADGLIKHKHADSHYIEQRRKDVLQRRENVRRMAAVRRRKLEEAHEYQMLRRDGEEMCGWIAEKKKAVCDDAHRDLASITNKLLRHEAFEAELKANRPKVEQINLTGAALIKRKHYESDNIDRLIRKVNKEWAQLEDDARRKGERLAQAADQKNLNKTLEDANQKLDELYNALQSGDLGSDLRSVNALIQKHTVLEQEMAIYEKKLRDIHSRGQKMAEQNHFDAPRIANTVDALLKRYDGMSEPAARRKRALEESSKWHQLAFDVDCELQWITEKKPIASSEDTGRNLTEALNSIKKHEQLEAEVQQHWPVISKILEQGQALVKAHHSNSGQIKDKCQLLDGAWRDLRMLMEKRKRLVELSVKEQQYLSDAAEVESWMNEKRPIVESEDYGIDEGAAQKLLAKHKALQNDMLTYKQWIKQLAEQCAQLSTFPGHHSQRFVTKQKELETEFDRLNKIAEDRRLALEDSVCLFEYMRESADLEQWINEQLQTAMSEEYGDDYEHLKELKSKFEEFKQQVKTGSERFVLCEQAANSILRRNPPFAKEILKKQEKLRSVWRLLLDYIMSREQKLTAAEELHMFNRDVAEHEEWVAEKMSTMSRDLGRNVQHIHSLWQQHEVLENEIRQTEPRLQRLLAESARLKEHYPGGNAEHISTQQAALVDGWDELRNSTDDRRDMLKAAYDIHRFNGEVRDLLAWADLTIQDMQSELNIHDLQQAEWLQKEHTNLCLEINSREPEFMKISNAGNKMIQANHYAKHDIERKIAEVEAALKRVRSEWTLRNGYLSQVVQWHAFQREAKQILAAIATKRNTLKSLAVGGNVATVEGQMKRLDQFEKALSTLDERTAALDATAIELIEHKHMETNNINVWRKKVRDELALLRSAVEQRRTVLLDALALAKYEEDVNEIESWIEDKLKGIRAEKEHQSQAGTIEEKMKRLQKHQALEAEIEANRKRVDHVLKKGQELCRKHNQKDVMKRCDTLSVKWQSLVEACSELSQDLEEARELLTFRQLINRVLEWMHEKEMLVSNRDMGRDQEHCRMLIEKLDGSEAGGSVDESTIEQINRIGEKLVRQGRTSRQEVQQQQAQLNDRWRALQDKITRYRSDLLAALDVHSFNKDVDDTDERIHEKMHALTNDDGSKESTSLSALRSRRQALESFMHATHQKLIAHDKEAGNILSRKPPLSETVLSSMERLEKSWKQLSDLADTRNMRLEKAYKLHKYLDDVKKIEQWAAQVRHKMTSNKVAKSTADVKALLDAHLERKAEIDGRQEDLKQLHEEGQRLISDQPEHKGEVQRAHKRVQNAEHQLRQTWESEKNQLHRMMEWLSWCDQAQQCEQWLTDKENLLARGDLGENTDSVEMLIKMHNAFEETMNKQSEKIDSLSAAAEKLIQTNNDYRGDIEARRDEIAARYRAILTLSQQRRLKLEDSKRYHEFIRNCGELITWMTAKLQLAYDESYLDSTNLRSKLQQHLAFDSELTENEKRLNAVEQEGEDFIQKEHFMKNQVSAQLAELRSGWDELRTKSALKTQRLREAYETTNLQRKVEDIEKWLDKIEAELSSEDHGRDIVSVEHLLKKLDEIEAQVQGRKEAVNDVVHKARQLRVTGSAATDQLLNEVGNIQSRYNHLEEPISIRRENLRDARQLFEWITAAEEELDWLNAKIPLAQSQNFGDSLQATSNLQKKHAALEKELQAHQTSVQEIESRGSDMIMQRHFASNTIQDILDKLGSALLSIKNACNERSDRLAAAMAAQEYLAEVAESEQWIREQMPIATAQETGRDLASADGQLRRLAVLAKEVEKFSSEVDRLKARADELMARDPYDANQIATRQRKFEDLYNELARECRRRKTQLLDASKYHKYVRQVEDLSEWLIEKEKSASSEDYGRDLEDCQQLIDVFETVVRELAAAGEKVAAVHRTKEELLKSGHPYAASITAKADDLQRLWSHVNEAAMERQQALSGARQVHKFDQEADQTIHWLQEKETMGAAMEQEDLTHADMATVKSQMQKHNEFVHGLKAVEKQVSELSKEAERLYTTFPDTRHHLEVRRLDMEELLKDILEAAGQYYDKLRHLESLQAYFHEYRELLQWIKRIQATITSEQLPRDVVGCEALASRHDEYNLEMQGRKPHIDEFGRQGRRMIQSGHLLAPEIQEKVEMLDKYWNMLCDVWKDRAELYKENMDCQQWKQNANQLEAWLTDREKLLGDDWRHVDSAEAAESMLREYDDFLVTLEAQGEKCEMVKSLTLLEQNYSKLRMKEGERMRVAEDEQKRRDTIKVVEKGNILASRRQERERRKTQEISLLRPSTSGEEFSNSQTLPRKQEKKERSKTTDIGPQTASPSELSYSTEVESHKTPSFTTRRSQSVRKNTKWEQSMGAIDMRGFLDRKQDLQSGGKRATMRSWKNYYGILCGQLLCFFKDEYQFYENVAAAPPVYIFGAECDPCPEYLKRKHAFKLRTQDNAVFMFACANDAEMSEWVNRIKYHASLEPSDQLRSYNYAVTSTNDSMGSRGTSFNDYPPVRGCATLPRDFRSRSPPGLPQPSSPSSPPTPLISPSSQTLPAIASRHKSAATVTRRASRRQSVYTESIYGTIGKVEEVAEDERFDTGRVGSSTVSSSGGTGMETLVYKEHTTERYERDRTDSRSTTSSARKENRGTVGEDAEFVTWIETHQLGSQGSGATPTHSEDNDSLRSKKKGFSSIFKRASKTSK